MTEEEDPIEVAWARVLSDWGDDEAHRKWLALCATLDRLDVAGTRYREVRDNDPDRAERAAAQIERLLEHAMKNLEPLRAEPPRRTRVVLLLVALAIMATLVGLAVWASLRATP